jgi:hypothetical protein
MFFAQLLYNLLPLLRFPRARVRQQRAVAAFAAIADAAATWPLRNQRRLPAVSFVHLIRLACRRPPYSNPNRGDEGSSISIIGRRRPSSLARSSRCREGRWRPPGMSGCSTRGGHPDDRPCDRTGGPALRGALVELRAEQPQAPLPVKQIDRGGRSREPRPCRPLHRVRAGEPGLRQASGRHGRALDGETRRPNRVSRVARDSSQVTLSIPRRVGREVNEDCFR